MSEPPKKDDEGVAKRVTHKEHFGKMMEDARAEDALGVRLPSGRGVVHVGQLPDVPVTVNDLTPGALGAFSPWSNWLIVGLACAHVLVVGAFAVVYWMVLLALPSGVHPAIFISATVAWFAFCGLLSTILAKLTISVLAEARLTQSRRYVAVQVRSLIAMGADRDLILRVLERAVYREGSADALDADTFAPLLQVVKLAKDMTDTLSKKDKP